ncbi:hypothetical protein C8R47DRAFT_1218217 [Mycena vitilis]|nr:hypothetical protein C8R47DRAFT_1218217 [Mycena vitilis]
MTVAVSHVQAVAKPPTTNLLPAHERTRIMRSARKLGDVMGTTPQLQDAVDPPPATVEIIVPHLVTDKAARRHGHGHGQRSSKREGVIFTVSSASSTSSLDDKTHTPPPHAAEEAAGEEVEEGVQGPVAKLSLSQQSRNSLNSLTRLRLVLTLTQPSFPHPYSCESDADARASTDSLSLLTRSLSILISTPVPASEDHTARRKKMVKLARMLGAPVPPALVFPSSSSSSSSPPSPSASSHPHVNPSLPPLRASTSASEKPSKTKTHARRRSRSVPPLSTISSHSRSTHSRPPPRKLVRPPPAPPPTILPALSAALISRPRPLAAYTPLRSASSSPLSHLASAGGGGERHTARTGEEWRAEREEHDADADELWAEEEGQGVNAGE